MSNTTITNPSEGVSNHTSETSRNNTQLCSCGSGKPQNECCGNTNSTFYELSIWIDEEHRVQGIPLKIQPHSGKVWWDNPLLDLLGVENESIGLDYETLSNLTTLHEIKSHITNELYNHVKNESGSIEIEEIDVDGNRKEKLYHISEDTNHQLEVV